VTERPGEALDEQITDLRFRCLQLEDRVTALEEALLALRDLVVPLEQPHAPTKA